MNKRFADPDKPYVAPFIGKFEYTVVIRDKVRRLLVYVPKDVRASTSGILLFPPNGVTAGEFLDRSGWREIADGEEHREKLVLYVLEAFNGEKWFSDECGVSVDEEMEYVAEAFQKCIHRDICCMYEGKHYFVGYGEGALATQRFALRDPAEIAGMVLVKPEAIEKKEMETIGSELCTRLHNIFDPDAKKGIRKKDVPLRVWFITESADSLSDNIAYWAHANKTRKEPRRIEMDTVEYYRTEPVEYPEDDESEGYTVRVTETKNPIEKFGNSQNRKIWKGFLFEYVRWVANPCGSYRKTQDPVHDLKMEYHYERVDGWMREWYVHVPQVVKEHPEVSRAVVFANHGYSCTGEIEVRNTDWYKVADKYGFIVVFPSAVNGVVMHSDPEAGVGPDNCPLPCWNVYDNPDAPNEVEFFGYMLNDVVARYNVNLGKVFASGTSMGGLMTHYLGLKCPGMFAAIAPTSGIIRMALGEKMLELPDVKNRPQIDLPVWIFGGEMEPFLLDAIPTPENRSGETIGIWQDLNRMPGGKTSPYPEPVTVKERWHDWIFYKKNIPMVRFTGIDYYPHATSPSMSWRIWEDFFSKLERDKNGVLIYTDD